VGRVLGFERGWCLCSLAAVEREELLCGSVCSDVYWPLAAVDRALISLWIVFCRKTTLGFVVGGYGCSAKIGSYWLPARDGCPSSAQDLLDTGSLF
jgi:hypothetical protein